MQGRGAHASRPCIACVGSGNHSWVLRVPTATSFQKSAKPPLNWGCDLTRGPPERTRTRRTTNAATKGHIVWSLNSARADPPTRVAHAIHGREVGAGEQEVDELRQGGVRGTGPCPCPTSPTVASPCCYIICAAHGDARRGRSCLAGYKGRQGLGRGDVVGDNASLSQKSSSRVPLPVHHLRLSPGNNRPADESPTAPTRSFNTRMGANVSGTHLPPHNLTATSSNAHLLSFWPRQCFPRCTFLFFGR